jgi:MATE family multidrug resistance protein
MGGAAWTRYLLPMPATLVTPRAVDTPAPAPRRRPWVEEARAMALLAWPLVLTNLSQFALSLTDTLFVGRLGTEELAAVTLGANLFFAALSPCFGLAMAAAPMTAQTRGRGPGFVRGMRRDLRAALWALAAATLPSGRCCGTPRRCCWRSGRNRCWRRWPPTT